jgi:hypothetical protein
MRQQKDQQFSDRMFLTFLIMAMAGLFFVVALMDGCAAPIGHSVCRHYALVEASVAQEAGVPVRIAVGTGTNGRPHATGQALFSGTWVDLEYTGGYVVPSSRPELAVVDRTYSLTQWAARMERSGLEAK